MIETKQHILSLSRTECSALRGIAILGIVLHNYCHWLGMAVKENEYTFTMSKANGIANAIVNPNWDLPVHLLSFFGHYGVPVFLFLSAYGLTMKYEIGGAEDRVWRFIKTHFLKLFSMMIVGFAAFTMVDRMTAGPHHYELMDVVTQLLLVNNLMPDPDHVIWPGPYWFFGLMLQLYVVYRLFLYKRHWSVTVLFMLICTLLQALCIPEGETLNRLRYNFIGGMLPFGLGLLYGRLGEPKWAEHLGWKPENIIARVNFTAMALLLLILAIYNWSFNFLTWLWVPVAVCLFCILMVKVLPEKVNDLFAWVGGISSAMFVCHPITRKIFIPISRQGDIYTGLLLYMVATVVLSMGFAYILQKKRR